MDPTYAKAVPGCQRNQKHPEALRSPQKPSEALRSPPKPSEALGSIPKHPKHFEAISSNLKQCDLRGGCAGRPLSRRAEDVDEIGVEGAVVGGDRVLARRRMDSRPVPTGVTAERAAAAIWQGEGERRRRVRAAACLLCAQREASVPVLSSG